MMKKISDLFDLEYGHSLELNKLQGSTQASAVNFVGRAATNNGVTARVSRLANLPPAPAGTLTVALNGQGGAGVAFLQPAPYYTAFHVMILTPKIPMTEKEKLWWAMCITANRFRFGFGRQANRTLKNLELPDPKEIPGWIDEVDFSASFSAVLTELKARSVPARSAKLKSIGPGLCRVFELFDVQYGSNLELLRLTRASDGVNFVSRSSRNNGVTARVLPLDSLPPIAGGALSVAAGGSVLETYVQFEPFYSGRDLYVLRPRKVMTDEELMFYAACLRANQWRYSYGRQANRTLKNLMLPSRESIPAWVYGSFARVY
jgi:hypothetical protein